MILIVAMVETLLVEGQSTLGLSEPNCLSSAAEMQNTVLDEVRYLQNQLRIISYNCTQSEELLGRHLNSITQNLQAVHRNAQKGIALNEDLQLKLQNLSNLYEEQVKVQRSFGRLLQDHDQYFRNQSAAYAHARQGNYNRF